MNQVRDLWNAGIEPAQAARFKRLVLNTIHRVEEICRMHRLKQDQLPAPTYRAYMYLKSLDVDHLPPPGEASGSPQPRRDNRGLHVRNLVSFCKSLQEILFGYAKGRSGGISSLPTPAGQSATLLPAIRTWLDSIHNICQKQNVSPLDLPPPSRRAYLWLEFLARPQNLEKHLLTLQTFWEMIQKDDSPLVAFLNRRSIALQVEFTSLPALYKTRLKKNIFRISANEGFISAPPQVLQALLRSALQTLNHPAHDTALSLAIVKDFAQTAEFRAIALAVELGCAVDRPPTTNDPRLEAIFQRVNRDYFDGQLPTPRLAWNKTITHRKLGQYQDSTDTVLISLTLDHPQVPEYVLEFVMYHELLHKQLGFLVKNGRPIAHTRAFRAAERKFRQFEQANAFLNNLGKRLRL